MACRSPAPTHTLERPKYHDNKRYFLNTIPDLSIQKKNNELVSRQSKRYKANCLISKLCSFYYCGFSKSWISHNVCKNPTHIFILRLFFLRILNSDKVNKYALKFHIYRLEIIKQIHLLFGRIKLPLLDFGYWIAMSGATKTIRSKD